MKSPYSLELKLKPRPKDPYHVELSLREHPPLRLKCWCCKRTMTLWQAKRSYRSPMSRFVGQLCCEYCQGGSFSNRAVYFPIEGQPKRRKYGLRQAHDYMLDEQMWTIWLGRLNGWLRTEIRRQRRPTQ